MSNNHSTVIVSQIHAAIRDQIMDRFSSFTWFLLHTVLVVTIMAVIVKQHIYKTIRDGILLVNFACPGFFFWWIISYPLCWKFFNVAATHQLRTTALSHHHCFTWAKTLYVSFFFFVVAVTPFFMVFYEFSMIVLNISIVCWLFIFREYFSAVCFCSKLTGDVSACQVSCSIFFFILVQIDTARLLLFFSATGDSTQRRKLQRFLNTLAKFCPPSNAASYFKEPLSFVCAAPSNAACEVCICKSLWDAIFVS